MTSPPESARRASPRPLALVTGGSHGIGYELARRFAEHGYDLVVVCSGARLDEAALELAELGAEVRVSPVDLSVDREVQRLWSAVRGLERPIEVVAVTTQHPPTVAEPAPADETLDDHLRRELHALRIDVLSTVHLTRRVVADMVARHGGQVLLVAPPTTAGSPAALAATTAFIACFADALRAELPASGVRVTALVPGPDVPDADTADRVYAALRTVRPPARPEIPPRRP
jgi:short-subunit dehydrogenase